MLYYGCFLPILQPFFRGKFFLTGWSYSEFSTVSYHDWGQKSKGKIEFSILLSAQLRKETFLLLSVVRNLSYLCPLSNWQIWLNVSYPNLEVGGWLSSITPCKYEKRELCNLGDTVSLHLFTHVSFLFVKRIL